MREQAFTVLALVSALNQLQEGSGFRVSGRRFGRAELARTPQGLSEAACRTSADRGLLNGSGTVLDYRLENGSLNAKRMWRLRQKVDDPFWR